MSIGYPFHSMQHKLFIINYNCFKKDIKSSHILIEFIIS
jgi:hypothetical protein